LDRLGERVLDHVLAVDRRAGHARAIAVQGRPQAAEQRLEGGVRGKVGAGHVHPILHVRRPAKDSPPTKTSFARIRPAPPGVSTERPAKERFMRRVVVRYQTRPEAADENARLIADVFRELEAKAPEGLRYLVLRLADGGFVHVVEQAEGAPSLTTL